MYRDAIFASALCKCAIFWTAKAQKEYHRLQARGRWPIELYYIIDIQEKFAC